MILSSDVKKKMFEKDSALLEKIQSAEKISDLDKDDLKELEKTVTVVKVAQQTPLPVITTIESMNMDQLMTLKEQKLLNRDEHEQENHIKGKLSAERTREQRLRDASDMDFYSAIVQAKGHDNAEIRDNAAKVAERKGYDKRKMKSIASRAADLYKEKGIEYVAPGEEKNIDGLSDEVREVVEGEGNTPRVQDSESLDDRIKRIFARFNDTEKEPEEEREKYRDDREERDREDDREDRYPVFTYPVMEM